MNNNVFTIYFADGMILITFDILVILNLFNDDCFAKRFRCTNKAKEERDE